MANENARYAKLEKEYLAYWERKNGASSSSTHQPFPVAEGPTRVPERSIPSPEQFIPGPAQAIQKAIRRRNNHRDNFPNEGENQPTTQQYIANVLAEPAPFDTDFIQPNWTSAIHYVTKEGYMNTESEDAIWTCINAIHKRRGNWAKIEKMVGIISSFNPNGLGDAMITLKDPTGTIEATIHHKVFQNNEFSHNIGLGAVLILQKVAVIKLMKQTKYLNITHKNVVGVVGKNEMIPQNGDEGMEMESDAEEQLLLSSVVPDSEDDM